MKCCVPGCSSHYSKKSREISYFHFPKEADLQAKWQDALKCPKFQAVNELVCSLHFFKEEIIFYGKGRRPLPEAIPHINEAKVISNEKKRPELFESTSASRINSSSNEYIMQNNDTSRLKGRSPVEISLSSSSRPGSVRKPAAPKPLHRLNKRNKKKQKKLNILEKFENILSCNPDGDQIFGEYVTWSLRGLTDSNKQKLKILIQKNIIELQEQEFNKGNSDTQTTFPSFEMFRIPSSLRIAEVRAS